MTLRVRGHPDRGQPVEPRGRQRHLLRQQRPQRRRGDRPTRSSATTPATASRPIPASSSWATRSRSRTRRSSRRAAGRRGPHRPRPGRPLADRDLGGERVPWPGGLVIVSRPPSAATRSCSPRIPVPGVWSAPPTPSSATSTRNVSESHAAATLAERRRWRTWRRSPGPRRPRSRPWPRPPAAAADPGATSTEAGTAERSASAVIAGPSPASVRIAGWMPRASSRSSRMAILTSRRGLVRRRDRFGVRVAPPRRAGTAAGAAPATARRGAAGRRRGGRAPAGGARRRPPRRSAPATGAAPPRPSAGS